MSKRKRIKKKANDYNPSDSDFEDSDYNPDTEYTQNEAEVASFLLPLLLGIGGGSEGDTDGFNGNKEIKKYTDNINKLNIKDDIKQLLIKMLKNGLDDKRKNWFDNLFKIPFNVYSQSIDIYDSTNITTTTNDTPKPLLKIKSKKNIKNTIDTKTTSTNLMNTAPNMILQPKVINNNNVDLFFNNAINNLNKHIYGLNNVKEEIIGYLAQFITGNKSNRILALQGSPGVGKTEIVRNCISSTLNKNISFINCGGIKDSSYLLGHDYTYLGSRYGKIVECLIESKQNDPIIFIDELDKISETTEGKEIENCFIHLLDSLQNIDFRDKYFSEIPIDLSKVLFIIAFNNINKINPILLDRIHIIKIQDPDTSTKINISKLHLIPKLYKNYSLFENNDIQINDECIKHIISTYTVEKGLRSLNRCLDTIFNRLNVLKLLGQNINKYNFSFNLKINFPYILNIKDIDILLKDRIILDNKNVYSMYS